MPRPYDLSSMTAVICFEAAARSASFKKAAHELQVTPAAVSHQIKALEADLGCSLFLRRSRGVELTEKGAFLFQAVQRGFAQISDAIGQTRERPDRVDVTIHTTTAISALWLIPKISAFWKSHPAITVSQLVSDAPGVAGRCDLSIQYANLQESRAACRKLFEDRIIAVGTRRFAAEQRISCVADLLGAPLIHLNSEATDWTGWADWFQALGHPAPRGRRFFVNNYMTGLQLAQDDVGAVLGWDGLVSGLLREQRLVQLVPDSIASPMAFYLKIHPWAATKARIFADWLVRSA